MPTYEWLNNETGERVTVLRRVSEYDVPPRHDLGECVSQSGAWIQQIPATNFQLRGSGWYKDGYTKKE